MELRGGRSPHGRDDDEGDAAWPGHAVPAGRTHAARGTRAGVGTPGVSFPIPGPRISEPGRRPPVEALTHGTDTAAQPTDWMTSSSAGSATDGVRARAAAA